jgi:cyclase
VVWVPDDRALFVGDIFGWGLINLSTTLRDDTAQHVLDTHARLIDFGATTVIPGHGPLCSTAELERWVDYFGWLRAEVSRRIEAGESDAQIMQDVAPPEDMHTWWRFLQWKHEDSLSKVLRAVRSGALSAT